MLSSSLLCIYLPKTALSVLPSTDRKCWLLDFHWLHSLFWMPAKTSGQDQCSERPESSSPFLFVNQWYIFIWMDDEEVFCGPAIKTTLCRSSLSSVCCFCCGSITRLFLSSNAGIANENAIERHISSDTFLLIRRFIPFSWLVQLLIARY